ATAVIHDHSVLAHKPRGHSQLVGRNGSAAQHDAVRGMLFPVSRDDGAHSGGPSLRGQGPHLGVAQDPHTVPPVLGLVERGDLRADDAVHDTLRHLKHRDLQAELARSRRHFQADVATAYDDQASARSPPGANTLYVCNRSEEMYAVELSPRRCERSRTAASCDEQSVISYR